MSATSRFSAPLDASIKSYLESADFLTNPAHVQAEYPDLAHLPLRDQAQALWIRELVEDLRYATAPMLVLERYTRQLSAAELEAWRLSSDPDSLTDFIKRRGAPDAFFVPMEEQEKLLHAARHNVLRKLTTHP
jgi:hypothetical protein